MKKLFLFAGYLASVAVLYFAIDFAAGKIFDKYLFLRNSPALQHAYNNNSSEQIAILGASRAAHHYNTAILRDSLGMSCYNYGMDGRNIFNQYVVAKGVIKSRPHCPEVILLEIAGIDLADQSGYNGEKLSNLNILYRQNSDVKAIIDRENPTIGLVLSCINLYRYNSQLLSYLRTYFEGDNDRKGYAPLFAKWDKEAGEAQYMSSEFYPAKEEYLRKLIETCLENGVKLIVYNSPEYYIERPLAPWELKVEAVCKEYDVLFVNHSRDTLFMSHREWFNEPFHLNDEGAKVYSSIVAEEMKHYLN